MVSFALTYPFKLAAACVCLLEPCLELFVEFPVFLFELYCGQVLLVGALLVIKREEKRFQVEFGEVLPAIEKRHGRVVVRLAHCAGVLGVDHLLVLRRRHVGKRCVEE